MYMGKLIVSQPHDTEINVYGGTSMFSKTRREQLRKQIEEGYRQVGKIDDLEELSPEQRATLQHIGNLETLERSTHPRRSPDGKIRGNDR
jgi:hypothetical protein